MFIRSGYSAHTRSRRSGTEHHHRAADVVARLGDCVATGARQPDGDRLALELSGRTRSRSIRSRRADCSAARRRVTVSRRRSSTNPSPSARTAVGRLEYTTPSSSQMSGSGPAVALGDLEQLELVGERDRQHARRAQMLHGRSRRNAARPGRAAEQLDRLHRHDAQREPRGRATNARASATTVAHVEPVGARAQLREQLAVEVERRDLMTGARQLERHAPGAGADVEHRAAVSSAELRARTADPRRSSPHSRSCQIAPLMRRAGSPAPRTGRRGRGARAPRAARAAPCRSAARTAVPPRPPRQRLVQRRGAAPARRAGGRSECPAYLSRSASSAARVPAQVTRRTRPGQQLEVGVPDPRDVAAVGGPVVEDPEQVELAGLERQRPQDLVGAGRVLDQQDRQLGSPIADRARRGRTRRSPRSSPVSDLPERRCPSSRHSAVAAERVVDVVEAGQRQRDVDAPSRRVASVEAGAAGPVQARSARRRPPGSGRSLAARRAAVDAQVPEVDRVVDVRRAAAAAVLGVRGVLHLRQRHRRILDAEVGDSRRARGRGRRSADRRRSAPAGLVGQRRRPSPPSGRRSCRARRSGRAGRGTGCRAARPRAQLRARPGRARTRRPRTARARRRSIRSARRAAASSVEATPPAMFAPARLWTSRDAGALEHRGGHRGGRRLAVGRRDDRACRAAAARRAARSRGAPAGSAPCPGGSYRRRARRAARARRPPARRRSSRPARSWSRGSRDAWLAAPPPGRARMTGRRQLGDRVAVGVHRERPRGG